MKNDHYYDVKFGKVIGLPMLRKVAVCVLIAAAVFLFASCGSGDNGDNRGSAADSIGECRNVSEDFRWSDMEISHSMDLLYATRFSVDYYEIPSSVESAETAGSEESAAQESSESGSREGQEYYRLITVREKNSDSRFLVVPEGGAVPSDLDRDIVVLDGFADHIYLAATAVMDHFCRMEGLDAVLLAGTKSSGWYIEGAKQAMEDGRIRYAGKYNTPDYELILESQCRLAIESTMIYHTPEVKEQLQNNGIPVLVDYSSYEKHPLGRSEWIKLYGALTGHEEEAEEAFRLEAEKLTSVLEGLDAAGENAERKTVAFFYITPNGSVNVRKSGDYVAKMIELAGGKYVFDEIGDDSTATATATIQMEDLYEAARDADYLIYNATIDGEIQTMEEFLQKSSLLADFKAVKSKNVYCIGKNMYQETSSSGTIILDIRKMLEGNDGGLEFLHRLK